MKKYTMFLTLSLLLLFATACNDQMDESPTEEGEDMLESTTNDVQDDVVEDETVIDEEATDDTTEARDDDQYMRKKLQEVNFQEIEIELDYADGKEFEAEIDYHETKPVEAKVENELNNELLTGKEAFDFIFDRISEIDFSSDRSNTDIINDIIKVFDLPEDYVKIEIEIEYDDGTEREIKERK